MTSNEVKFRTLGLALVLSFVTGAVVMHRFETLLMNQNPMQIFTRTATRFQRQFNSEERNTSLSRQPKQEELRYGQVVHGTHHIIIYNSVPKCGSRTLGDTSRKIFKKRSLVIPRYQLKGDGATRTRSEMKEFLEAIKAPAYCQGHGNFLFVDHSPRPIYINFIREPVSRMVSAFYFTRFGDHSNIKLEIDPERVNDSIEDCILGHGNCIGEGFYLRIFCGFDYRCGTDFKWALEQAKSNIDKYYTFIGITEDYEASLRVLERLMPDIYNGITELYLSLLDKEDSRSSLSKTKNKQPLSQELNDTATRRLAVDFELYNYIYDKHRALKVRFGID